MNSEFNQKIMKWAGKFQNNLIVSSISQGMMSTMGVLMGSAIINILINLPITPWTNFLNASGLMAPLSQVVQIANAIGLFMSFGIGRTISEKMGAENPVEGGIIALFSFLIVTPLIVEDGGWSLSYLINLSSLGSEGVMTCMIVSLCAGALYTKLSKTPLKIKMPDSVPPFVSQTFENLPGFVVSILPFVAMRVIFGFTAWGSFTNFMNTIVQTPLTSVGNSLGGHLVLLTAISLFWWMGMHGTLIAIPILMMLTQAPLIENISVVAAGGVAPNLLSFMTIMTMVQMIGGPGCLFGLYVDMALFSKSERYKAQGKLQFVPGLFNVIEPAVYGLPIVLNFTLLVPFVCLPLVEYVLMYLGLTMGLFRTPLVMASNFLPGPVLGFLAGGGLGFGIFIVVMCLLSCVVYYPFVKFMDIQQLKIESSTEE